MYSRSLLSHFLISVLLLSLTAWFSITFLSGQQSTIGYPDPSSGYPVPGEFPIDSAYPGPFFPPKTQPTLSMPAQIAIAYVANREGIRAETLTIVNEYPITFPSLGRQFHLVTILDNHSEEVQVYKLLVDLADGRIEDNIHALRILESQAHQKLYGKLEKVLFERLQTMADTGEVPVAVWMSASSGQSLSELQATVFSELSAKYPEAREAMTNSGKPMDVSDPELAQRINAEYTNRINIVMNERIQPLVIELKERGFNITQYTGMPSFAVTLPKSMIVELSGRSDVSAIYLIEGEEQPMLSSAVPNSLAPVVWSNGYDGTGVTVAILESGNVDTNNSYLNHASTALVAAAGVQDHTTRVASNVASFHNTYTGMAPGATILSAGNSDSTQSGAVFALRWASVDQSVSIVNYSGGFDSADGELRWIDRAFDYWARQEFVFVTQAAGNSGSFVTSPGRGWNVFTVGAYNDQNNTDWSDDDMRAASAYINPCGSPGDCEGREKPEVVAVGDSVRAVGVNNVASTASGTSYAAPQVAGLAALLIDRSSALELWPEAIRAIIMASATHNIEGRSIIRFYDPTDIRDGAGAINASLADITAQTRGTLTGTCYVSCWWGYAIDPSFTQREHYFYADSGDLIRVAISWWSNPDTSGNNYSFNQLDTDIDLEIIDPMGVYLDISISTDNNYEMVEFVASSSGLYRIRVHKWPTTEPSNFIGIALVKTDLPYNVYLLAILKD